MNGSLVWQGVELMLVGMGTVFVFLTLLVVATALMSRLVARWLPEPVVEAVPAVDQGEEVAAIAAALDLHRRRDRSIR